MGVTDVFDWSIAYSNFELSTLLTSVLIKYALRTRRAFLERTKTTYLLWLCLRQILLALPFKDTLQLHLYLLTMVNPKYISRFRVPTIASVYNWLV